MKKFFVLLLSSFMLYASDAEPEIAEGFAHSFKTNAKDYYKAWAVGYCLGYYKIEDNVKFTFTGIFFIGGIANYLKKFSEDEREADLYVSKMVYFGGVEPLEELKAYIDEKKDYFDKNRTERCLKLFADNYDVDKEIERIIKKYRIDELQGVGKYFEVTRKDKTK